MMYSRSHVALPRALRQIAIRQIALWCLALSLGFVCDSVSGQQPWGRFRGPNGTGMPLAGGTSVKIPNEVRAENVLWKIALPGIGHSSPVVGRGLQGERLVFLTSGDEATGMRYVLAVHATRGQVLWQKSFPAETHRKHKLNSFASPTPVLSQSHLYTAWGTPEQVMVQCFDFRGELVWKRDLGGFRGGHGFGVSPIVYRDLLVVPLEQQGQSRLLALDRDTGETRWEVERESNVHYSTPCIFSTAGTEQLVFTNWEQGVTGLDPATGATLWSADVFDKTHVECSIGSPVVSGDLVIATCGWLGHGNEVIAVRPGGSSDRNVQVAYRIARGAPLCTTPMVAEDRLYLWADNGIVTCADVATGKKLWQKRVGGNYYASPVAANGKLLNIDVHGKVTVLRTGDSYDVLGESELGEGTHSSPALADGRLYIRTFSQLMAVRADGTRQ